MPVLRIGYVTSSYPLLFRATVLRNYRGIYIDIWKLIAASCNRTITIHKGSAYGGYSADPTTGRFDGLLGQMENRTLDGVADDYALYPGRIALFDYTPTFDYSVEKLYRASDSEMVDRITQFVVFQPVIIALIVASAVVYILSRFVIRTVRRKYMPDLKHEFVPFADIVLTFATILLFAIYSAAFAGNATLPPPSLSMKLNVMAENLKESKMTLLIQDRSQMNAELTTGMFGTSMPDSSRLQVVGDPQELVTELCTRGSTVYYDYLSILTENGNPAKPIKPPCQLEAIDTSDVSMYRPDNVVRKRGFGVERATSFYYARDAFRRSAKEWMRQIILRLYDDEKLRWFWWRRYSAHPRYPPVVEQTFTFSAVGMEAIQIFIIIIACLYGASALCYLIEIWLGASDIYLRL